MLATTVQHIPAEVLNHVFKQLEPGDLKSVVLVCERWRDIAEAPNLWTWVFHWVNRGNLANMPYILAAKRMQAIKTIAIRSFSEELLRAIIRHPSIQELDLTDADWSLSTINSELLVSLFLKIKVITVDMNTLSNIQTIRLNEALKSIPDMTSFHFNESCSECHMLDRIVRIRRGTKQEM